MTIKIPSVSVALSKILVKICFHDEEPFDDSIVSSMVVIRGSYLPVPIETTHIIDSSGHNVFASCNAIAAGLFTTNPPSYLK